MVYDEKTQNRSLRPDYYQCLNTCQDNLTKYINQWESLPKKDDIALDENLIATLYSARHILDMPEVKKALQEAENTHIKFLGMPHSFG